MRSSALLAVLAPALATAAVAGQAAEPAAENPIESTGRAVRSATEWLARGVDSWFGDKPFESGGEVSDGRLSVSVLRRHDTGTDFSVRLNARVRLPNLGEKSFVFFGRDNPREVITDRPGSLTRQDSLQRETEADRGFFAGIGTALRDDVDLRLGVRGGLRLYAQARWRKPWQLSDADRLEFRETLFLTAADRLGSTTALSYEHAWSPSVAVRWLSQATVTQRARRFEWSSVPGVYLHFGEGRQLSLELPAEGIEGNGVTVEDYGVRVRWQQPVHENRLIGHVAVGRFRPRPDAASPRDSLWAVGAGLLLRF